MRIVSATTAAAGPEEAVHALSERIAAQGMSGALPDFVALHGVPDLLTIRMQELASQVFAGSALHGGTSCRGVLTGDWPGHDDLPAVGAFAIFDPCGSYGTASADLGTDPRATATRVMREALTDAGRPGEAPDLVLLTVAPGAEEQVLAGIRSAIGTGTPIVGGSSADSDMSARWAQFSAAGFHTGGVVISALFPSQSLGFSYQSGFAPVGPNGVVTAAKERKVIEIDGIPAARVYSDWTNGHISVPDIGQKPRSLLSESSLFPLGRVNTHVGKVPIHLMMHPSTAHPDGSLDLLADIEVGERIWLMAGSADNLVQQAGRVARNATASLDGTAGCIVICCAGTLWAVGDRMKEMALQIDSALGGAPYLGLFAFGEQGTHPEGRSEHGNLMVSCAAFGSGRCAC